MDHRGFGGGVGCLADLSVVGGDRGCIDQHTTLTARLRVIFAHGFGGHANHVECADQVDTDYFLEQIQGVCTIFANSPGGRGDARTVHQAKQLAHFERCGDGVLRILFLRDVAMLISLSQFRGKRLACLVLQVGQQHVSTVRGQHAGGARTQTRCTTGHDENFICDIHDNFSMTGVLRVNARGGRASGQASAWKILFRMSSTEPTPSTLR